MRSRLSLTAMKTEINKLILRANLLTEVIAAAEQGENISETEHRLSLPPDHEEMRRIAGECTRLILERIALIREKCCNRSTTSGMSSAIGRHTLLFHLPYTNYYTLLKMLKI